MRVLVVDDDESSRYLAATILRASDHVVVEARDGVEALEVARAQVPDLLLTDILMPKMDGYMLVREWKRDLALSGVPVVFLTASYTDDSDARLAMDLGAARFLLKPIEPELLLEAVAEAAAQGAEDRPPRVADDRIMAEYGERLVRKLEKKVVELQEANRMLRRTMGTLSQELEVKTELIRQLDARAGAPSGGAMTLAHDRLADAVASTDAVVVAVDRTGSVTYLSPGAVRLFGREADAAVGEDYFASFVPEEDRAGRRSAMGRIVASGLPERSRGGVTGAEGQNVEVEWLDFPTRDAQGEVSGIVAFGMTGF